jgi:hypothetical protein
VLLTRCAWHRGYYGYTILIGVASWRGWTVGLSDGICRRCARRVRATWLDERRRAALPSTVQCPAHHRPDRAARRDEREERFAA